MNQDLSTSLWPKRSGLILVLAFVLVYILPLGVRPIVIPDETRYAMIPWEMIQSGDWAVPRLIGLSYFEKPVLGYWLNAASMLVLGETPMAIRLSSALAAGLAALVIHLLARRFFRDRSTALLAPAIFLTMGWVYAIGTFSVLDSPLTGFLTVACALFFLAAQTPPGLKRQIFLALFGVVCGLAFMTKGFTAFAVPVVTIVPYMLWEKRWKELFTLCWTPMLFAFLTALPWALVVHGREPDFWRYFFWVEHIQRYLSDEAQHPQPLWFFLPVLLAGALPWTLLFPAAAKGIAREHLKLPLIRYAVCWALFPFLFFSASSGKLGTYILPCFPPLALLMAFGLVRVWESRNKLIQGAAVFMMVFLGLGLLVVWGVHLFGPDAIRPYTGPEAWKNLLAGAAILSWLGILAWIVRKRIPARTVQAFALAPIPAMIMVPFLFPTQLVGEIKAPGAFLEKNAHLVRPEAVVFSDDHVFRAVAWYYRRPDVNILLGAGEISYGINTPEGQGRKFGLDEFSRLVTDPNRSVPVILVQKRSRREKYMDHLPTPSFVDQNRGFVFQLFDPPGPSAAEP
ncbi:MAG: phospholipid carrier-dependent glycosyltransferase [Deltaproteobacteria bacterium]|nr:phospholipid carrier-dependent glycosyltransferase [Deltaproteobacteria bacterium]